MAKSPPGGKIAGVAQGPGNVVTRHAILKTHRNSPSAKPITRYHYLISPECNLAPASYRGIRPRPFYGEWRRGGVSGHALRRPAVATYADARRRAFGGAYRSPSAAYRTAVACIDIDDNQTRRSFVVCRISAAEVGGKRQSC